jgi:hypothetical protein
MGRDFTLLVLGESEAGPFVEAASRRGVPLHVLAVRSDEARDIYGADLTLIRPDRHIAWRGNRAPANADQLLARVTGWSPLRGEPPLDAPV